MTAKSIKKLLLITITLILLLGVAFRYTPYLFPVKESDIRREPFHSVKFYDRHGGLLQEVLSENAMRSVRIDLDKISPYFIQAIIAAEDKNFYHHGGVDYHALLRAVWQNIRSHKIVSGASTITLQLARLIRPGKRTFINKIKETYLAFRIEAGLNKNNILQAYINRLPMGGNLYGVEGAARAYFGISASDLTLAQATFLASIPNSPNRLNPYQNLSEIKERQKIVLERMVKQGMITSRRIGGVLKEKVLLKPTSYSFLAPHFVFNLMKSLPDSVQTVKTTIDIELQKMVGEQIKSVLARLKDFHVSNACALLLENTTGEVLAYVGSANYFNTDIAGQNDGIQALRQPGSTLKPFLYILAMEKGFNPATLISDIPTHYTMPTGIYSPKNYSKDFHGPVRLREALANSLNVPAVRTLAKIGTESFLERLHEYHFNSLNKDAQYYGIGLALGGGEVTLYELTRAYMCLARKGVYQPIKEFLKLNNKNYRRSALSKKISTPQFNYLITDILNDHYARTAEFGFNSVLNLPFPCSAKTGTSFRFCDNWTIGFTRDYTLGVWVGNFDHTPMLKVSGVSGAGPLFANIMYMLYNKKDFPEKYPKPMGLVSVKICPLSGQRPGPHCPTTIEEMIPERDLASYQKSICRMHTTFGEKTVTVVPVKFRAWAEGLGFETRVDTDENSKTFRIVNPQDGSEYLRLPNLAPTFQSIRFQLQCIDPNQTVKWYLNNELIQTTKKEHTFLWQAKPGNFILKAVSVRHKNLQNEITFMVK